MKDLIIILITFSLLFWITARIAYLKGIQAQLADQDLNVVWQKECEAIGGRYIVFHDLNNFKRLQCILVERRF